MATTYNAPGYQTDTLDRALTRSFRINWETTAYIVIFALAVFTRFYILGERVMSHDESLHVYYSWRLFEFGEFQHTPLMHGPIIFHANALFYFLFGDNDFTGRIYTSVLGVIMVMFPLLFRRWIGRWGALLACVMFLISPLLMYYNRYIREDTPAILASLIMIYCIFQYVDGRLGQRRKAKWLFIFSAAMLWNFGSKETAFIYVAILGMFFTAYFVIRLVQHLTRRPLRDFFHMLVIAALLAGTASLAMFAIINIAFYNRPLLEDRVDYIVENIRLVFSGGAPSFEFVTFVSWTALLLAFILAVVVGTALWSFGGRRVRFPVGQIMLILALFLAALLVIMVVEEVSHLPSRDDPAELDAGDTDDVAVTVAEINRGPYIAAYALGAVVVLAAIFSRFAGWWRTLDRFAELDILLVTGTLILPWLTPLIVTLAGANPTDYSSEGVLRTGVAAVPMFAMAITIGLVWNWKRWLVCVAVFYILFAFFFTTMFTNPNGLLTGMFGSLGYWLEQQGVRRGSQPQYYYQGIIMPMYEYLPLIGSFLAMLAGLVIFWRHRADRLEVLRAGRDAFKPKNDENAEPLSLGEMLSENTDEPASPQEARERALRAQAFAERQNPRLSPSWLKRPSFVLFMAWLGVLNFIGLTLAGEKMPWLATHITFPLIILTAWYFGTVFEHTDWSRFWSRGWLYLLLIPLLVVALLQVAAPFLTGRVPWQGLQQEQLATFYQWLALVGVSAFVIVLISQVAERTGGRHLRHMIGVAAFVGLSVITFRAAWTASFINYDQATEYLVYAHAAPGVGRMVEQIEELSQRTTDGLGMRFAWGGNAWPVTWYFRDLENEVFFGENPTPQVLSDAVAVYASEDIRPRVEPLLEDRYYRFEYIRMWWPEQSYFNLTAQRVSNALDFSAENTNAGDIRRGMFDIWWARDYTRYGEAIGQNFALENWPVAESLYFYVRRDIAAQVWNLGVGEGTVMNPLVSAETNLCTANWDQRSAEIVFYDDTGAPLRLQSPIDVAVGADNLVYVAEKDSNRIAVFNNNGQFVGSLQGGVGSVSQPLNQPHGVAVGPNNDIVVADTWNFRVQVFNPDGSFVTGWGSDVRAGYEAQTNPTDGFWGPRDVTTDDAGNVYVADTGNKRVRVYSPTGEWLRDIGSGGTELGQLEEPTGLAVVGDRLYVADTWNRRISVFSTTDGTPLFSFPVRAWYEDLGNRPYLAIDETRNLVYIADPDAGRVLVHDTQGNCLGSFGQAASDITNASQFDTVGGLAVDDAGNVYVADMGYGRVLRFAPWQQEPVDLAANAAANAASGSAADPAVQPDQALSLPQQNPADQNPLDDPFAGLVGNAVGITINQGQ